MSRFDEEPDGDPHGECAAEIDRLKALNVELAAALEDEFGIDIDDDAEPFKTVQQAIDYIKAVKA